MRSLLAALLLLLTLAGSAIAVEPDEMLKDPAQEARAEAIGRQLRCPVCKTESIEEESDADFTKDLRKVVREQIAAGKTDAQVAGFSCTNRYRRFHSAAPALQAGDLGSVAGAAGAAGAGRNLRLLHDPAAGRRLSMPSR